MVDGNHNPKVTPASVVPESGEDGKIDPSKEVVIVVEDSPPNRNILAKILEKCGYAVLPGNTGVAALNAIERCKKENLKLVMIVSDIMMPKMDGHQLLELVRQQPQYKNLPFLFVTAMNDKDNVVEARKRGVTGYLLKPITMEKVMAKIMELFPDHEFPLTKVS